MSFRKASSPVLVVVVLVALLAQTGAAAVDPAAWPGRPDPARFAYHIRLVRIVGDSSYRGAAFGCGSCGKPIVMPSEEAWGTADQLSALSRALGGAHADAITGYIVRADESGEAHFEGAAYLGAVKVTLSFVARTPLMADAPHDLEVRIQGAEGEEPLAEARLLASAERTVAVAAPSPVADEWLVVAITALDAKAAEERVAKGAPIETMTEAITAPELISKVQPKYPAGARTERREGKIILQAVIDAEGIPRALTVLRLPPGTEDLAAAAVEAVQQWRYKPALAGGKPIPVYFTVVVTYMITYD